jgi:uncharacterized protein YjbI with pentapeptide repeats
MLLSVTDEGPRLPMSSADYYARAIPSLSEHLRTSGLRLNSGQVENLDLADADVDPAGFDNMQASHADFSGATIVNSTSYGADLAGAKLVASDLTGMTFDGSSLQETSLAGAYYRARAWLESTSEARI